MLKSFYKRVKLMDTTGWIFTGVTIDHGDPCAVCELCDQKHVRYHFEIGSPDLTSTLMVGSSCILKYSIEMRDECGQLMTYAQRKSTLLRLERDMQDRACLDAMAKLVNSLLTSGDEKVGMLQRALQYYDKNKYLSPNYMLVVAWQLNAHKIDHRCGFFKVSIKTNTHKDQLINMPDWKIAKLVPYLSSAQRSFVTKCGYTK